MSPHRFSAFVLVYSLALGPTLSIAEPQTPPSRPPDIPTFGVGTSAVTLDVVVRDKKGNAVRDLGQADFEVFEDGVKQRVESFQVFGRTTEPSAAASVPAAPTVPSAAVATAPTPAPPAAAASPDTRPQVIAFVFDRLSADARNTAHKAAMTYLDRGHVEGDLVGVFAIDLALRTIQPFTHEPSLIRAGLERAASQEGHREAAGRSLRSSDSGQRRVSNTTSGASSGTVLSRSSR